MLFCRAARCGYTGSRRPRPRRAESAGRSPAPCGSRGAGCSGPCCGHSTPTPRRRCTCRPYSSCWRQCGHKPSRPRSGRASAYRPWHGRRPARSRSSIPDGACCGPYGAARRRCSPRPGAGRCWGCTSPASIWPRPRTPRGPACLNRGSGPASTARSGSSFSSPAFCDGGSFCSV